MSTIIAYTTNTGSYSWTIPSVLQNIDTLNGNNVYQVAVFVTDPVTQKRFSGVSANTFSIVAPTTQIAGPLYVSRDDSTPASQNLFPNQTNVTFAKIKITNTGSINADIRNIKVVSNSIYGNYLANIRVYDGSTQIGNIIPELSYNGGYYYMYINNSLSISGYATKVLTLVADIKPIASQSSVINLGIDSFSFNGWTAGMPVYGNNMTIIVPI
jgi:hypothetical protein